VVQKAAYSTGLKRIPPGSSERWTRRSPVAVDQAAELFGKEVLEDLAVTEDFHRRADALHQDLFANPKVANRETEDHGAEAREDRRVALFANDFQQRVAADLS